VAETEDGVVGRLSIARDRSPLSRHVAEFGLMVAARARRRGIGEAMIEEAIAWARGLGILKLELTVFPHNTPAIALYRKLGFQEEGLLHRRYLIDGRYFDAMLMGLDLDKVE
jgi:RimJ/RimL family protein N-acetyltransferase